MKRLRPCWDEESCANLLNVNLELEKDAGRRMKVAGFLWLLLVEALLPENDRKRKSVTINCGCSKEALVSGEEVIIDKNDVDCGLLKTCHCSLTEGKCSLTEEKCSLTEGNCSLTEGNCSLTEDVNENSNQTARLNCAIKLRFYFFRICERKKEKKKDEIEEPFSPPDSSNIKKKKKKKYIVLLCCCCFKRKKEKFKERKREFGGVLNACAKQQQQKTTTRATNKKMWRG